MKLTLFSLYLLKILFCVMVVCCVMLHTCPAQCQTGREEMYDNSIQDKPELTDNNSQKINKVPYTKTGSNQIPLVADAHVSNTLETVAGLKEAGYSLDGVVVVLKNDTKKAPDISIACLKAGYNGTEIHSALLKAGFSKGAADAAVPPALRTKSQPFFMYTNDSSSDDPEQAMIEPNPFTTGVLSSSKQNKEINSVAQDDEGAGINPYEVRVNVGVSFNGLGNWNNFQNERFESQHR